MLPSPHIDKVTKKYFCYKTDYNERRHLKATCYKFIWKIICKIVAKIKMSFNILEILPPLVTTERLL